MFLIGTEAPSGGVLLRTLSDLSTTRTKRTSLDVAWRGEHDTYRGENAPSGLSESDQAGSAGRGHEAWETDTKRRGCWRFEGLTELLPIYERVEDGAEMWWTEYKNRSV